MNSVSFFLFIFICSFVVQYVSTSNLLRCIVDVVFLNISILFVRLQTALHWAAKHGNSDVIKMLCGTPECDVNVRSVSAFAYCKVESITHVNLSFLLLFFIFFGCLQNVST